ncbi:MAG: hypothetical protein IJY64_07835 [Bacteroidaceae bacterium]|nr:hypothetical protein [Bacteroidaceae bacterium]
MNEKDKIIARALQKSFTQESRKNRELCHRIENNLPPRSRTNMFLLITFAVTIVITSTLMLVQWNNVSAIIENLQKLVVSPMVDKGDTIAYILGIMLVGFIIVWQVLSFIDDYYSIKNEDIMIQTLRGKE